VDASEEVRLRTFAMEDRLQAIETALASLRAALVPGDRGQAAPGGQTEDKARVAAHRALLRVHGSALCT
jgi:hypothetical protein